MIQCSTYPTLVLVWNNRPTRAVDMGKFPQDMEVTQRITAALLACAIEDAAVWSGPVVIAPAGQVDHDWIIELSLSVQSPVTILPLISCSNIGQQLNALDQELRNKGATQLVFIGSDAPELTTKDYLDTINALRYFDTILKPVKNAGIALMASNKAWPDLSILPWGTDKLGKILVNACRNEKQSVITLDSTCNIDELDGFVKLIMLLEKDGRPARRALHQLINEMISVVRMVHTIN